MYTQTANRRNPNHTRARLFGGLGEFSVEERIHIVRGYLRSMTDGIHLLICHMYLQGYEDDAVCNAMHLTQRGLELEKKAIAEGILAYANLGVR